MPKEQLSISRFEGGLVDEIDDRDLPENSVSDILNLRVDKPGQLSLIPSSAIHGKFNADNFGSFTSNVNPGFGAYEFASDQKIDLRYQATTFATGNTGGGTGTGTTITTSVTHSLCVGDIVRIVGTHNKEYDGYHRILEVGTNTFLIEEDFGNGLTNQDAYVFKIGKLNEHQHHFLAIQDQNNVSVYDNLSFIANEVAIGNGFGDALGGSAVTGDTDNVETDFFDVDGELRVSDGNFNNLNNKYARWYGYIPPRPIGNYQDLRGSDESGYSAHTQSGGSSIQDADSSEGPQGTGFIFTNTTGSGDAFVIAATPTASLTNNRKVHVSFNMTEFSSDYSTSDKDGVGQYPAVYFVNATGNPDADGKASSSTSAAGTDRNSDIYIAKPGMNHFEFTIKNSGPEAAYLIFYNTHKSNYTVRNIRITGNETGISIGGFSGGYYDVPASCFEPGREEIQSSLEDYATHDGRIVGYIDKDDPGGYDATTEDPDSHIGAAYITVEQSALAGEWYFASDHKFIQLGMTWIYDGKQESKMSPQKYKIVDAADKSKTSVQVDSNSPTDEKSLAIGIEFATWPQNPRITGARLYVIGYGATESAANDIIEDPLLLATIDAVSNLSRNERGSVTWADGKVTQIESASTNQWKSNSTGVSSFPSLTYKILNGYDAYDNIEARWSHSVVVNRRLYAANVRQKAASSRDLVVGSIQEDSEYKNYPDRMLRSPVNKFDVLPSRNEITVAGNDGQSITGLKTYKGKLLQFKQETVYIINVSEDFEYLEDQVEGIGIKNADAVCDTDVGVAWTTHKGAYLYDGQKIIELTDGKIDQKTWFDFVGWDGGRIGYSQRDQALLVYTNNTSVHYIYSLKSQSWTKGKNKFPTTTLLSNAVNWHWSTGIFWVAQQDANTNGESMVSVETTAYSDSTAATGQIKFNGGTVTAGHEFWIKDSGNTARQVTKPMGSYLANGAINAKTKAQGIVDLFNAYNGTYSIAAEAIYKDDTSPDGYEIITLTANEKGAHMNASGSASEAELGGLFMDDNGSASSEAASKGSLTNFSVNPLANGSDVTQHVMKYYVNRGGATSANVTYTLELLPLLPDGQPDPDNLGTKQITYTTSSSDDSQLVAEGLLANVPTEANQFFTFAVAQEASTDEWYLQVTGNYVNPATTTTQNTEGAYRIYTFISSVKTDAIEMHRWHLQVPTVSTGLVKFVTKDVDFGAPAVRKKIYKFYITYKSTGDTNVIPYFVGNGLDYNGTNRKTFADSTYYTDAEGLKSTSGSWQIAELKPDTSSDGNNLYSVKFALESVGQVPKDFMINDITIVYRVKSVK